MSDFTDSAGGFGTNIIFLGDENSGVDDVFRAFEALKSTRFAHCGCLKGNCKCSPVQPTEKFRKVFWNCFEGSGAD